MAQKQFKIGLSNTDKQNMAQDVYERVLALTFAEYDSAETYNEGDFVVYNDLLYKCLADNVTGTWDATKWQQATLQDLLDDIESAVAFVNDKANVDGNYPTMTVGMADNLTPYDESAGDDQDEPFILQATGTGNGTQPDFSTGSAGLMKEKQGNTVVVNQLTRNPNFADSSVWETNATASLTIANNKATVVYQDNTGRFKQGLVTKLNHTYLAYYSIKSDTACNVALEFSRGWTSISKTFAANEKKVILATKRLTSAEVSTNIIQIYPTTACTLEIDFVYIIDLTQWFNGDIPQDLLDNPENFFRYYQGSLVYNEGELVNANGRYIKCIGMNQWDEILENGKAYRLSDGAYINDAAFISSKNKIKVIPNGVYYFSLPDTIVLANNYLFMWDANGNYVAGGQMNAFIHSSSRTMEIPSNVCYIAFSLINATYGTTYNNDISINLYYEDEPRCLTYEPYQVLTNNDTGTEELLAFDKKTPDGVWYKKTKTYTCAGTENWEIAGEGTELRAFVSSSSIGLTPKYTSAGETKVVCNRFIDGNASNVGEMDIGTYLRFNISGIATTKAEFNTWLQSHSTTIQYETDEPTTEQGTPYSENLVIDDFGSMDFGGTNGVPQGALIFYPVDYKAFVDTLYKYSEGTPSDIALKSDLPTAPQTWAESLPGYDATKTQTLKNVEGTLTWVDD